MGYVDPLSSGMVSGNVGREYVSPEVKAKYDEVMEMIQRILSQPNFTQADADKLSDALKQLAQLQNQGLESGMNEDFKLLLLFFKTAGYDPAKSSSSIDPTRLQALKECSIEIGGGQTLSVQDVLKLALDPARHARATQTMGDMLLDFTGWAFDLYTEKLRDLQDQVEIATKAIRDLQALQEILNQVQANTPDNYKYPPKDWMDIPKELQNKIREQDLMMGGYLGPWKEVSDPKHPPDGKMWQPEDFSKVLNYITGNGTTAYIDWSSDYFKEKIGFTVELRPDTVLKLLKARDDLFMQLALLEKGGADTSEGSSYDMLTQVVNDIKQHFPIDEYPPGTDWDITFDKTQNPDGTYSYDIPSTAIDQVTAYITAGQGTESTSSNTIDKALQATQTFSSKQTDEMKVKNLELNTIFDIMTQLMKSWDKIIESTAQKISR